MSNNTRFKGSISSERLSLGTLSDTDMFQTRHLPGTENDSDKGVSKAVLQSVPIGICTTAAATEGKSASLASESCPDFSLLSGREVLVYFTNGNTAATPSLNFAGTGSVPIVSLGKGVLNPNTSAFWMHLKYVDITVNSTRIQKWLLMEESSFEGSHNVCRKEPKNITKYYSDGTLWQRLNGTNGFSLFEDIYVGDYFEMSRAITAPNQDSQYQTTGTKWVTIAGIDTLMGNGDSFPAGDNDALNPASGKHHLVMIPGKGFDGSEVNHFGRKRMNSSNSTTGCYKSCEMRTSTLGSVASSGSTASGATINQQLYAEFGTHLKTTRELISNTLNSSGYGRFGSASGCSSSWEWSSEQAILMSEIEVYGSVVWSSSGFDTGTAKNKLPVFNDTRAMNNRSSYYWLKDVASAAYFCYVSSSGNATYYDASYANIYVRPRFVIAA